MSTELIGPFFTPTTSEIQIFFIPFKLYRSHISVVILICHIDIEEIRMVGKNFYFLSPKRLNMCGSNVIYILQKRQGAIYFSEMICLSPFQQAPSHLHFLLFFPPSCVTSFNIMQNIRLVQ